MCAGKDALLRVGAFIIVRRYTYEFIPVGPLAPLGRLIQSK